MLNPTPGRSTAGSVFAPLDQQSRFAVYNHSGSLDVAFDVAGTFEAYPPASAYSDPIGGTLAPTQHGTHPLLASLPTCMHSERRVH